MDFATLSIKADSRELVDAEKAMERLGFAGEKVEATTNKFGTTAKNSFGEASKGSSIAARATDALSGSLGTLKLAALAVAGPLVALFSSAGALRAAETYTNMTNGLKAMGLSAEGASARLAEIAAIANRSRAPLDATLQLYNRIAMASEELGASQVELAQFTETVGKALSAGGVSANQASGALLQLSQAMSGGTVRAEEFNSILEGAYPLALAAARGMEEAGGSVARLRTLVNEGKVSSEAFFRAVLSQSGATNEAFGRTSSTVGQAITQLGDQITLTIGKFNESAGVTRTLAAAISAISNNMDTITAAAVNMGRVFAIVAATQIPALIVAMAGFGARMVFATASMLAATTATGVLTGAMARLSGVMAVFGGPVGIAIGAAVAAFLFFEKQTTSVINAVIANVVAFPKALYDSWNLIPAAVGDIFTRMANLAIGKINDMFAGLGLGAIAFGKLENQYAGAGTKLGNTFVGSIQGTFKRNFLGDALGAASKSLDSFTQKFTGGMKAALPAVESVNDEIDGTSKALKDATVSATKFASIKFEDNFLDGFDARLGKQVSDSLKELEADFRRLEQQALSFDAAMRDLDNLGFTRFGDSLGQAGDALDGMLFSFERLAIAQEAFAQAQQSAGGDTIALAKAQVAMDRAKIASTIGVLGASKNLFAQQSTAYKVIAAAEKAFAVMKLANTIRAIAMDSTQTASSVANSVTRGTADTAAGASKMFSQLGVWAFPAVAAMIALVASLGGKTGGGSASFTPPSAEDMQAAIGTGTVLGDSGAQSQSLANAMEIMASNSNKDLEFSSQAVRSLRNIESGIGALTTQIARQVGLGSGGAFSTQNLNLGQSGNSGIAGLFASSTTRNLYDQGISFGGFSIAEAIAEGVEAQVYNVVEQIQKNSGFLGIGGGTKTTYQSVTGPVNSAIQTQFGLVIGDIGESVVQFVSEISKQTSGLMIESEVRAAVNALELQGANLSFKDMSGEEIEKALQAYFGSVADTIAGFAGGFAGGLQLHELQRAGEGLFETLARVTRTITTVNSSLAAAGLERISSIAGNNAATVTVPVMDSLVGQFGGLDAFSEAVGAFADKFLTDAERMAPVMAAVTAEMERLGFAGVKTNDEFKALVQGLDLTTATGQETFASLLSVAPAFAKVNEYTDKLNGTLKSTASTVQDLARIEQQRRAFDIQIMELEGRTQEAVAARRADALAALDASLQPLQAYIFTLQDQAAATELANRAAADLAAAQERIASERFGLEGRLLQVMGDTAAIRERELATLDASNRAILSQIFALEDAAIAASAAAEAEQRLADERALVEERATAAAAELLAQQQAIAAERFGLEGRLLTLIGDTAAIRERELSALDASNRDLLIRIFGIEDERAATEAATAAMAEAARVAEQAAAEQLQAANELAQAQARIAQERFGLEGRLLGLLGDTAAIRERELAALDPSNRALLERIFGIEDERAATEAATRAAQALAAEQERIASEQAARNNALNSERSGLERRLLELQGMTNALRALELAALDAVNRPLLEHIFALQDEQAAAQAAAQALASLRAESERLANERAGLYVRLYKAQGDEARALWMQRQNELAAVNFYNRSILEQIFALEDATAASDALRDAQSGLRDELSRLIDAVTPKQEDLSRAIEVRDVMSDGLKIAEKLANSARDLMGDNEQIMALQRDAARRELFAMVETRRIDESRIDDLVSAASTFGALGSATDLKREQARTANLLMSLATIQQEQSVAMQVAEQERAAQALDSVRLQIEALHQQIGLQEGSLEALTEINYRIGSLTGLGPTALTTGLVASGGAQSDEALRAEMVKLNEYVRELVKINHKQERRLAEIELQGETV